MNSFLVCGKKRSRAIGGWKTEEEEEGVPAPSVEMLYCREKAESRHREVSRLNMEGRPNLTMRGTTDQERRPGPGGQEKKMAELYRDQAEGGKRKPSPWEGGV